MSPLTVSPRQRVNKVYISGVSEPQQHVLVTSTHPFFYVFSHRLRLYHAHVRRARVYSFNKKRTNQERLTHTHTHSWEGAALAQHSSLRRGVSLLAPLSL